MTVDRCPSKLDHRASGTVLQCLLGRGHATPQHRNGGVIWLDDDEHTIQGGDACCAGEPIWGDPTGLHSDDCPEYLAWADRHEAQRREQPVVVAKAPVGVRVTLALTRRQANAILAAEFTVGHGVRRSRDLEAAERRLMDAVRAGMAAAVEGTQ